MGVLDDLKTALTKGLDAGAAAVRQQGTAIKDDFTDFIRPNFDAIVAELAQIGEDRLAGRIGDQQAQDDAADQLASVKTILEAEAELGALAIQTIANAVLDALKSALNAAVGIALF